MQTFTKLIFNLVQKKKSKLADKSTPSYDPLDFLSSIKKIDT